MVPSVSWISTASCAALTGAVVKFADVIDPTVCVDPESIKRMVTPLTKAVIVVHLFGRPVDGIAELAIWLRERNIYLIEDCSHAPGAVDKSGMKCGSIGDIGVFSFQQQKNMVTLGEGGICVTNDLRLRDKMIGFRSLCAVSYDPKGKYLAMDPVIHPMGQRYWMMDFVDHGHNFRMLDMQAAVGRVQLRNLPRFNARRRDIARSLAEGLKNVHSGLVVPDVDGASSAGIVHSWHVFHVLIKDKFPLPKENFMWVLLHDFGIKTWNHYSPMHLASSFRSTGMGKAGDCPVAEALFEQYVSLPIHPRLTDDAVLYMIESIRQIALRSHVPRPNPTPLLTELLLLTEPPQKHIDSSVQSQWNLFQCQIEEAVNNGFFERGAGIPPISVSRAPGRLDLMGGNDDYTGGLVFECTIAEATFVAAQATSPIPSKGVCEIIVRNRQLSSVDIIVPVSVFQDENIDAVSLSSYLKEKFPESRWQLYVVGIFLWLKNHYPLQIFENGNKGISLLIWTEVPLNRGVSSSASVEIAVMKAAANIFGISLAGEILATACQWVENQVCSSACGLMDQMAVTLGSPFMAMRCQPAIICAAPPLPNDLTIYALDSGVSHEVSGIEYEAARVAAFMGYKVK